MEMVGAPEGTKGNSICLLSGCLLLCDLPIEGAGHDINELNTCKVEMVEGWHCMIDAGALSSGWGHFDKY